MDINNMLVWVILRTIQKWTVGITEMDIHKCWFKGCMEFCKHFNRDKNLLWHQFTFVSLHAYFTNTPELVFLN